MNYDETLIIHLEIVLSKNYSIIIIPNVKVYRHYFHKCKVKVTIQKQAMWIVFVLIRSNTIPIEIKGRRLKL